MAQCKAYAAMEAGKDLVPHSIERREPGDHDVHIDIKFCGVCHSDLHQVRDEWGGAIFPMVPGHEIVGVVTKVGSRVSRIKKGQHAGVGCFVDSCRTCDPCRRGVEMFCDKGVILTYNGLEKDRKTPTYGGYSQAVVVHEDYVLTIPDGMPLDRAAPLLCAGITTYSPLKAWGVKSGQKVGVVGLGGLGHMGVKIAAAMGAEVTVLSTSPKKEPDAKKLGAKGFALTTSKEACEKLAGRFDAIINTVSAHHDVNMYLRFLKRDGVMVMLGVPPKNLDLDASLLVMGRRKLVGSLIGGIPETQEMLNFCHEKEALPDVEVISAKEVNGAYERMLKGDVRYRFVIDCATV